MAECRRCDGCGKVANTENQEPWSAWLELPLKSAHAVVLGLVRPVPCPSCGGTGECQGAAGDHKPRGMMAAEFECVGCGRHIIAVQLETPPASGLCAGCEMMGAERYKAFQDWQDKEIDEAEFKRRFEAAPVPAWELERRRSQ